MSGQISQETAREMLARAESLLSRMNDSPSEDVRIFAEWDDLDDAVARARAELEADNG